MGEAPVVNFRCGHCSRTSPVRSPELEDAYAVIDGLRETLTSLTCPFFEIDSVGRITAINDGASARLGIMVTAPLGQRLLDVVDEKHKKHISQLMVRVQRAGPNDAKPLSVMVNALGVDSVFTVTPFHSPQGRILGATAVAVPESTTNQLRPGLPKPVNGVMAWRSTLAGDRVLEFELSQPKDLMPEEATRFRDLVEHSVKMHVSKGKPQEGCPAPFEDQGLPYDSPDGQTKYFTVRGLASNGPEMPFGGSFSIAEGYVFDVTDLHVQSQEAVQWRDRWRALSQLAFNFVLLVDTVENVVLSGWNEVSVFGEKLQGKELKDITPRNDQSATQAFSQACWAHAGTHYASCSFWHAKERREISAECVFVWDPLAPEAIFMGAGISQGGGGCATHETVSASSSEPVKDRLKNMRERNTSPAPVRPLPPQQTGEQPQQERAPAPANTHKKPPAPPSGGGGGGGLRLTPAALELAQGRLGMTSRLLPPPGLHRKGETPPASQIGADDPPKKVGSKGPPSGRPPAPGGIERGRPASSRASERSLSVTKFGPPRVLPVQVVVYDQSGTEVFRSHTVIMSDRKVVADLLTPEIFSLVNMPDELAEDIDPVTHMLLILDEQSGDTLQIANPVNSDLGSLQKHGALDGQLTFIISPLEEEDDAFEFEEYNPKA